MFEKVFLKYDGEAREINVNELDLNPENPTDTEVLTAVAQHLEIDSLREFVVERSETIINLRPSASHGKKEG